MKNSTVVVLDNGGHTIKTGVVKGKDKSAPPRLVPNAIIRSKGDKTTYFGHELEDCKDYSSLHYRLPLEKGYIIDWDAQKAIWDGVFSDKVLGIDTTASSLVLTEPYFNLPNIQEVYDQFIFEEYEFSSYYRCTPASLIPHGKLFSVTGLPPPECMIIVDSGFSFTHVVPILSGNIVWDAVKRLDVGGKLLTNHLKELVSFRQWNMMEETYIMNDVKERCCYVSQDFKQDLEITRRNSAKNEIVQQYVLPDLTVNKHGHIRQPDDIPAESDQILLMNNERFSVPELIFRPDDIGLEQCGLADTIAASISLLPVDLQGMFWANIGLIGGNTRFPGFRQRLLTEVQSHVPSGYEVVIYECDDPVTEAYKSALGLATSPSLLSKLSVTRSEYQESGSNASWRKFRDWRTAGATTTSESDPSMDPESAKAQKDDRAVAQERQGASTSKTLRTRSSGKTGIGGSAKAGSASISSSTRRR